MAETRRQLRQAQGRGLSPARRRALLQTFGVIVIVALLLWGADTMARIGAETLLERNIQDATGVEVRPEVDVRGVFFLPQVIRGSYSEVHVTTQGITSAPLRIDRVDSQLFDVRVPFHDVLVRDIRRVGIGRSVENLHLTYEDLNAYFAATGRRLELAPGRDGAVRVTGNVEVANQSVPLSADATLSVEGDALRISPENLDTGSGSLDAASRLLLGKRLRILVPLGTLPFGHHLTGVRADPDGVHLTAMGTGIVVQP
jgi:LmeA-like phospholipid-binding